MHIYRVYSCSIVNQNRWKDTIYVPQPNSLNSIQTNQEYNTILNLQQKPLPFYFPSSIQNFHWCFTVQHCCQSSRKSVCSYSLHIMQSTLQLNQALIVQLSTENNRKQNLFLGLSVRGSAPHRKCNTEHLHSVIKLLNVTQKSCFVVIKTTLLR